KQHGRLAMRIGIDAGCFEIRLVLLQGIKEVGPFVSAGDDEVGEVGNIIGADMTVGNGASATVANVVGGLNVVLVGGEERAVGSDFVARSTVSGQFEFRVLIQNIGAGGTQRRCTHVPTVHEGQ